jgi:hypothetical protein
MPAMRKILGVRLKTADKKVKNPMIAIHDPALPAKFLF